MALPNGIESHQELLEAQAHVWNHMFNFINSMSLKCAIQLGIPDTIQKHGKPMALSELVNTLSINKSKSQCIYRLMRILIHSKFFVKIKINSDLDQEGYWLTPASRLLMRDDPLSVAPLVLAELHPCLTDSWHNVAEWFHNDEPTAFATTHGLTLWEYAGQEPGFNQLFNVAMAGDSQLVNQILIDKCKQVFEGLKSMVDVGGGIGIVAKVIADACPGLKCVVLDLPHVVADLKDSENLTFVGGDMFESIPQADAVFFKWIFHDWSDDECGKILRKCKEAIPSKADGGKVIIVDMIVEDDQREEDHEAVETQLMFDMQMMVQTTGKERTEKEWAKLFFDAGFTSYKVTPVLGLRSLIEVFP